MPETEDMNSRSNHSTSDGAKGPGRAGVELTVRKGARSSERSGDGSVERDVVYQFRPTTLLGRLVAAVVTIALLLVVVLFSLVLFSVLVSAVLIVVGYALWRTHRATQRSSGASGTRHDGG